MKDLKTANKVKKILIIRLGAIGDVVHSTIISTAIKNKYPRDKIHFLTLPYIKEMLKNDLNFEKIFEFDNRKKNNLFYLFKLGLALRKENYDVIFNLTNAFRTNFISFVANPKKNIKRSKQRKIALDAFFNAALKFDKTLVYPKNLSIISGQMEKDNILKMLNDIKQPIIIFNPGGENDNIRQGRIWPFEYWIELGNKLYESLNATIIISGSKNEEFEHQKYKAIKNAIVFSGKLKLNETLALFSLADIVISGDSGPLHMASSQKNTKTIALMGSTAKMCDAYGENCYNIYPDNNCVGCFEKKCKYLFEKNQKYTPCMKAICVDKVFNKINEVLKKQNV